MILTTLIGVQTICMGVSTYYAFKLTKRTAKLSLVKKEKNGFKHYKVGGF